MFYRVAGLSQQLSLSIPMFLNSGVETRLLVMVSGPTVSVTAAAPGSNGTTTRHTLVGEVQPCTGANCTVLLGARESGLGTTRYEISGTIYSAAFYPSLLTNELPDASGLFNFTRLENADDFNLLLPSVVSTTSLPGPSELGDGGYSFDGFSALALDVAPRNVGAAWSASFWVRQTAGYNGYLFAKVSWRPSSFASSVQHCFCKGSHFVLHSPQADRAGSLRSYALYSSFASARLTFYYTIAGRSEAVHFNQSIADGQFHHIHLVVSNRTIVLQIDASAIPLQGGLAAAPLDDCGQPNSDCYFHIGQRMSTAGGAFRFLGEIYSAHFHQRAFTQVANVLPAGDPRILELAGGSVGPIVLRGLTGPRIRSFRAVSANFSVGCNVSFLPTSSTGYLWAKSNFPGTVRRIALYASAQGLRFFYKPTGSTTHHSVQFAATDLFDGNFHTVVLAVSERTATIVVDGTSLASVQLVAPVDDCSAVDPDCSFFVGQRSSSQPSSTWTMSGTIASASLYYTEARRTL
jgi:hypothetical protein